nr:reverse transcriptase domain-containing protein [Tanacetum cinerariifolium]
MSQSAEHAQTPANFMVRNTARKERKAPINGPSKLLPNDKLCKICKKHYNQILPIMAEKVHQGKLQGVHTRLTYGEHSHQKAQTREKTPLSESESCDRENKAKKRRNQSPYTMSRDTRYDRKPNVFSRLRHEESSSTHWKSPVSTIVFTRLGARYKNVFTRLGERRKDVHSRLGPKVISKLKHTHDRRHASFGREWDTADRVKRWPSFQTEETYLTESENERGGHWNSKSNKQRSADEDLSKPWIYEEADPFTPRIRNFEVPKRTRMPTNIKTYDGAGDSKDHLKIFHTAAKIERWVMPTWCHMFNSMLIGSTRVWFDTLPPESIDSYNALRKAFLVNFLQQKKYIKDPVKIHHIKQKEGESTKAFMERFKAKSRHVNGASDCMRISGFMHGITNHDLIKRLNDNILKFIDEMMSMTTAFLRGEVAATNQSRKKASPTWKHNEVSHKQNFDKRLDFNNKQKPNQRHDGFTPLVKTPKEIITMDMVKFKAPPPMSGLAKDRNKNKFCEFHGDKGNNTYE